MSPRTGRRPGQSGTREQILDAARASFAENGYDKATIREVASRAGVDPALVHHYFGNKQQLFVAAIDLPVDPAPVIESILEGDVEFIGHRIAHTFLAVWDGQTDRSPMLALIRSATANEQAAAMFREFLTTEIFARITKALRVSQPRLRASLVASQLMGTALLRYVIRLEPLASVPSEDLAGILGPTLQRYLTGRLPIADVGAEGKADDEEAG